VIGKAKRFGICAIPFENSLPWVSANQAQIISFRSRECSEVFDLDSESESAEYYFDYIHEHGEHPR
jgi:hypothetical protein